MNEGQNTAYSPSQRAGDDGCDVFVSVYLRVSLLPVPDAHLQTVGLDLDVLIALFTKEGAVGGP